MKHIKTPSFILVAIITLCLTVSVSAQRPRSASNTNSKMLYHNGPIMTGAQDIYLIWYGCWTDNCDNRGSTTTSGLVIDFAQTIGGSPYLQMNSLYVNASGHAPSGAMFYAGSAFDNTYSHGFDLTEDDIADIVREQLESNAVPQDPAGIYIVLASADIASNSTGFCSLVDTPPLHGVVQVLGGPAKYGFIGNPNRCPTLEAPQFIASDGTRLPTANGDFAGDAMVAQLAHLMNTIPTNPQGGAWYDRYGLENADKCQGTFGTTYNTANGARANIRLYGRDYLIQQNWVNDRHGRCAMQMGQ
jgi:hypothetical protein